MALKPICFVLMLIVGRDISAEESFCGNQCFGGGLVTSHSCYCDKACVVYNDCCSDSKYFEVNKIHSMDSICKREALVVNSCPSGWKGPDFIIESCTTISKYQGDPVGDTPVTSSVTGVTYSNYYCAICNGDAGNSIMWNVLISCPLLNQSKPVDSDEIFKNIFYNHPTNEWGYVFRDGINKKMSFHGCDLSYEVPENPEVKVRHCETKEVNSCPETWKLDTIKNMCNSYTDSVFSNGTQYKNFYCAICNRVDQSTISCGTAIRPRTNKQQKSVNKNNFSFAVLMNIFSSDGNLVAFRNTTVFCLKGEIFDKFSTRCRNIVCGIPGYELKNGSCAPNSKKAL